LIFHRVSKGKPGQPVKDTRKQWNQALKDAKLACRTHLPRPTSECRPNLVRAGVDPMTAMAVSGHKTRSMLDHYNIIAEEETAAAPTRGG
jgi:hypothetical protein